MELTEYRKTGELITCLDSASPILATIASEFRQYNRVAAQATYGIEATATPTPPNKAKHFRPNQARWTYKHHNILIASTNP